MIKKLTFISAIVFMLAFSVLPALASLDLNVAWNDNQAEVENQVSAQANTGTNYADGSYGGSGGSGGDINNGRVRDYKGPVVFSDNLDAQSFDNFNEGGSDGDVRDSSTGSGGAGGNGAAGGTVYTGAADASAGVDNTVNSNLTEIEACPCDTGTCDQVIEDGDGETQVVPVEDHFLGLFPLRANVVVNRNSGALANGVDAQANTGDNIADGSYGGRGGRGGDISNSGEDVDTATTGDGGAAGNGGDGGLVTTDTSTSQAGAVNLVNSNVTRITRTQQQ